MHNSIPLWVLWIHVGLIALLIALLAFADSNRREWKRIAKMWRRNYNGLAGKNLVLETTSTSIPTPEWICPDCGFSNNYYCIRCLKCERYRAPCTGATVDTGY